MQWPEYVASCAKGRNQTDLAILAGVDQSTISRWIRGGGKPSVTNAIELARAVEDSPIVGLLAAGFLREDEVEGVVRVSSSLSAATTEALLTELGRRLGLHVTARKGGSG